MCNFHLALSLYSQSGLQLNVHGDVFVDNESVLIIQQQMTIKNNYNEQVTDNLLRQIHLHTQAIITFLHLWLASSTYKTEGDHLFITLHKAS